MRIGDLEVCKDFHTGRDKSETIELSNESYDFQSTGGFSGNNWHEHNVAHEKTAVLSRGESVLDGRQATNKPNDGSEIIEA